MQKVEGDKCPLIPLRTPTNVFKVGLPSVFKNHATGLFIKCYDFRPNISLIFMMSSKGRLKCQVLSVMRQGLTTFTQLGHSILLALTLLLFSRLLNNFRRRSTNSYEPVEPNTNRQQKAEIVQLRQVVHFTCVVFENVLPQIMTHDFVRKRKPSGVAKG